MIKKAVFFTFLSFITFIFTNNGLLIFLDDSENIDKNVDHTAVTQDFADAFSQEAGPILVSATIIANLNKDLKKIPEYQRDPKKLFKQFNKLNKKYEDTGLSEHKIRDLTNIVLIAIDFNKNSSKNWIIKKINSALYLLIPKKYLQDKNIDLSKASHFTKEENITQIEQSLGLKINHMETVNASDIQRLPIEPKYSHYFITALWHIKKNKSNIFVTNREYNIENNTNIPSWSIYIVGHGLINEAIVNLTLEQFKDLLSFLETKINTKLLYYNSCYAAGVNSEALYNDAKSGIQKIYSYAIITQAATDITTARIDNEINVKQKKLHIKTTLQKNASYNDFLQEATKENIDYDKIAKALCPDFENENLEIGLPQIKFPGLPWFSVIDNNKVVSINSILAKTYTKPLDIKTFFAKKGLPAMPLGILLYTKNIPLELIINTTKNIDAKDAPNIISMIPGNATHHIKKISSDTHKIENLFHSFLNLEDLIPQKLFLIDSITALNSKYISSAINKSKKKNSSHITVENVIVLLKAYENIIYFTYQEQLYKITGYSHQGPTILIADKMDKQEYERLLKVGNSTSIVKSNSDIQVKSNTIFAQQMTTLEAAQVIKELLDEMPRNSILRIPKIEIDTFDRAEVGQWNLLALSHNYSFNGRKIIWFDKVYQNYKTYLSSGNFSKHHELVNTDLIIDASDDKTKILYKENNGKDLRELWHENPKKDYAPTYEKILAEWSAGQNINPDIDTESIYTLLTPENIAKIKSAQEAKIIKSQTA